jgi:hypothetical protein
MSRFTTATLLVLLTACGGVDTTGLPPGDAQLAVLNALPPGTVAELRLDDARVTLPELGERISRVIPAGSHRLEARTQSGTVVASAHFSVGDGGRRTAILGGAANSSAVTLVVGADTASAPVGDATKVRLVHTVQGTPSLEGWLYPAETPPDSAARLVSPFDYGVGLSGEFPGYAVRPAGAYRIRVTHLVTGQVQAEGLYWFGTGQVWSVVLTRRGDGELELLPIREL